MFKYRHCIAFSLLLGIILLIYYPSLFQVPRADQLNYLLNIEWYLSNNKDAAWWERILHVISLNRSQFKDDVLLFRPFSYLLIFLEYSIFHNKFILWQLTSILLHLIVSLAVYWALLASDREEKYSWFVSIIGGVFFAVAFPGMENVTWIHIPGYLVATAGMALSIGCFVRIVELENLCYFKPLFFTLLLSCFFYELSLILSVLMILFFFFGSFLNQNCKKKYLEYASYLLLIPIIFLGLNFLDYSLRYDLSFSSPKEQPLMSFGRLIISILNFTKHLFLIEIAPGIIRYLPKERLELGLFDSQIYSINVSRLIPGILFVLLGAITLYKRFDYKKFALYVPGFLCLIMAGMYIGLISFGRIRYRDFLPTLTINTYYSYIFLSFIVLAIGFIWPINREQFSLKTKKWVYTCLQLSLLILIVIHAQKTWTTSKKIQEVQSKRWELVQRVNAVVRAHMEEDFSFSLDKQCFGNPTFPWFDLPDRAPAKTTLSILDILFWNKYKPKDGKIIISCENEQQAI